MRKTRFTGMLALATTVGLALAGCSGAASEDEQETIRLGYIPAWADAQTTSYLLKDQLERIGYNVELVAVTEAAVLYTGVAQGDIDMYTSAWIERTQLDYWNQYKDDLESVSAYYDEGLISLAVPDYVEIDSLPELAQHADDFDGRIVGIEPSAGQMKVTEEDAMPAYGLDENFELVSSSFATMLTALQDAVDNKENIVVTLSRPHWANSAFNMRDLEDPKGALGEPEALHMIATKGFSEKYPEAAELIAGIHLDDDVYSSLENRIMNEYSGNEEEGVKDWLQEYPDAFETIVTE